MTIAIDAIVTKRSSADRLTFTFTFSWMVVIVSINAGTLPATKLHIVSG
jgi:hexokinase